MFVNAAESCYDAENICRNRRMYIGMVFLPYEFGDDFDMSPAVQSHVHSPRYSFQNVMCIQIREGNTINSHIKQNIFENKQKQKSKNDQRISQFAANRWEITICRVSLLCERAYVTSNWWLKEQQCIFHLYLFNEKKIVCSNQWFYIIVPCLNFLSHSVHGYLNSSLCVSICALCVLIWANDLPQITHWYGRSFVWILKKW